MYFNDRITWVLLNPQPLPPRELAIRRYQSKLLLPYALTIGS